MFVNFFKFITLSNVNMTTYTHTNVDNFDQSIISFARYKIEKIINDTFYIYIVWQILKSKIVSSNLKCIFDSYQNRVNFNVINQWTFSQLTRKHNRLAVNIYHAKLRAYIMILRGFTIGHTNAHTLPNPGNFLLPPIAQFLRISNNRYCFEGNICALCLLYRVPLSAPFSSR